MEGEEGEAKIIEDLHGFFGSFDTGYGCYNCGTYGFAMLRF